MRHNIDHSGSDLYAVVGNPIQHSLSPWIHQHFAQQTAQRLHYRRQLLSHQEFDAWVKDFFAHGGAGLNVTLPFKPAALRLAMHASTQAIAANAANTLLLEAGELSAHNTDGQGLLADLQQNLQLSLAEQRVLILGAGGAVAGIIGPLLDAGVGHLHIANRTASKATALADKYPNITKITAGGLQQLPAFPFDLILNGTAGSLSGHMPELGKLTLARHSIAYDLVYAAKPTAFMDWATQRGVERSFDGLGMLVEQAAASFTLWRGIKPDSRTTLTALRQYLIDPET